MRPSSLGNFFGVRTGAVLAGALLAAYLGESLSPHLGAKGASNTVSVIDHGAIPDGIMRSTAVMAAGSPVLNDPNGSFSQSTDVGKWIEVIGAGAGGETFNACAMTSGSNTLTCADGAFAKTDQGRYIFVTGAGANGNLTAQVTSFVGLTQVKLSNLAGLAMVPAAAGVTISNASAYLGYMTLDTTILSVQSANRINLNANAHGSISNATYAYGTDNHVAFQSCLDAVGASGGGACHAPAVTNCLPGAICGFVVDTTNQQSAYVPNAMAIRYDGVSLTGDAGETNLFCHGAWAAYTGSALHSNSAAAIRGNCLNIGDQNGPRGAAGLSTSNTTVAHLHLYGMTNGNTYNSLVGAAAPMMTTGDGWDITNKGIYMSNRSGRHSGVIVEDVTLQDFKGEELYEGGSGMTDMVVRDSTFQNSNGDGLSVSAGTLTVANNRFINLCNAGIENGLDGDPTHPDVLINNTYKSNLFQLTERSGLALPGLTGNASFRGQITIADNTFDTIGEIVFNSNPNAGPASAIYLAPQGNAAYPPGNVKISGNVFHDVNRVIQSRVSTALPYTSLTVELNKWQVDRYPATTFLTVPFPVAGLVVQNNSGELTAAAAKNGVQVSRVYTLNNSNPANSMSLSGVVFHGNSWNFAMGTPYYLFSTKNSAGWAALAARNITWIADRCPNCTGSGPDYGAVSISPGGTIKPYGPVVWLTGGSADVTMTVDASKEDDQSELMLVNRSTYQVTLGPDANLSSAGPVLLPANGRINLKYLAQSGKWTVAVPPAISR